MTYCVAIKVDDGLVFAGDTRTSAGVDDVRTYNKLHVMELEDRVFVLLSAGNLATTQAVIANVRRDLDAPVATMSLRLARYMFDAAEYVGSISVRAQHQIASQAQFSNADLRTTFILGGQIRGEEPAIYLVYPEGNCISSSPETPFLQIGESKYGKPILDRVIRPEVQLEDAARCALVSLDSTMRSNISVGPPIDLAILPTDSLKIAHKQRFDLDTPFYARMRESWGHQLVAAFRNLPKFDWEAPPEQGSLLTESSQQAANG